MIIGVCVGIWDVGIIYCVCGGVVSMYCLFAFDYFM